VLFQEEDLKKISLASTLLVSTEEGVQAKSNLYASKPLDFVLFVSLRALDIDDTKC
jgi:hypothetical protein